MDVRSQPAIDLSAVQYLTHLKRVPPLVPNRQPPHKLRPGAHCLRATFVAVSKSQPFFGNAAKRPIYGNGPPRACWTTAAHLGNAE
jgi:hypothetical protein